MYITIPAASPDPYRQLKSLSFAPETDLTLASVPVNEFRADIITEDAIAVGSKALLFDDLDNLWANYVVTKQERLDRRTIRITAQSPLTYLDRWTVAAKMFQNVTVRDFINALFNGVPKSGYLYTVPVEVDAYYNEIRVTGFCPEQTARERLQWLCLTIGAMVKQCFAASLQILPAPDVDVSAFYAKGALIPLADTYMRPSITYRVLTRSVAVTGYENFTDIDPNPDPEEGYEPGEEPAQGIEWESAEDDAGVTWWFQPVDWTYENESSPGTPGQEVTIDGVTLISGDQTREVLRWLTPAYFRDGEIQLECINNDQYYPGQKVRVYTDEETVYTGYIQSCDFSFGIQAKARLTISTDLIPVQTGKLTIEYRYGDIPLGRTEMILPDGEPYDVENPTISWTEGNRYVEYTPITPRTTGTAETGVTTVQYTERVPARIEIVVPPNRLTYTDGDEIDYTGMIVRAYSADGKPWTQGGLLPDGYIPMRYLTLPETEASIAKSTGGARQSDLDISPSLHPAYVGPYCRVAFDKSHWLYPSQLVKFEYRVVAGVLTTNVRLNPDGTARGFLRYVFATDDPEACKVEYIQTRANGEVFEDRFFRLTNRYTYSGKTVYYNYSVDGIVYDDNEYVGPVTDYESPLSTASPVKKLAWTMVYGEIIEGVEPIPVQWTVPGTGEVFTAEFDITIRPMGLTMEEATP